MTPPFTFVVRHRAAPQGSKVLDKGRGGKPFMRESSKGVRPFRTALKRAVLGGDGRPTAKFAGPVMVTIAFEFRRPASNEDVYPTTQNTVGDIDKLTRAVLDGLTEAKVIEDDRFVVALESVTKLWGEEDQAVITVRQAPTPESLAQSVVDFGLLPPGAVDRTMLGYPPLNPFENQPSMIDFEGLSKEPPGFA